MNLYLTQDRIGTPTGGGAVTYHEYRALESLGDEIHPIDADMLHPCQHPFVFDNLFLDHIIKGNLRPKIAHIYAGCFTQTVRELHNRGAKVSYTAAAHSVEESRKEHESLGAPFDRYPHLTDPELWKRYVGGYLEADLLICPSTMSADLMRKYGRSKDIEVIPHGCEIPLETPPLPKRFAVGYMGQVLPDKGVRYLMEAWKKLDYKDAELIIAGNNVNEALPLWRHFGGGRLRMLGFVPELSEFYRQISVYVQPSVSEGFGIEVLEAMAHGRPVICSRGSGAADVLKGEWKRLLVDPRDVDAIVQHIEHFKKNPPTPHEASELVNEAGDYSWSKVRGRYVESWRRNFQSLGA